jgi:hypothetical protein
MSLDCHPPLPPPFRFLLLHLLLHLLHRQSVYLFLLRHLVRAWRRGCSSVALRLAVVVVGPRQP